MTTITLIVMMIIVKEVINKEHLKIKKITS